MLLSVYTIVVVVIIITYHLYALQLHTWNKPCLRYICCGYSVVTLYGTRSATSHYKHFVLSHHHHRRCRRHHHHINVWNIKYGQFLISFYEILKTVYLSLYSTNYNSQNISVSPNSYSHLHVSQNCVVLTWRRNHENFKAYLHNKKYQGNIL